VQANTLLQIVKLTSDFGKLRLKRLSITKIITTKTFGNPLLDSPRDVHSLASLKNVCQESVHTPRARQIVRSSADQRYWNAWSGGRLTPAFGINSALTMWGRDLPHVFTNAGFSLLPNKLCFFKNATFKTTFQANRSAAIVAVILL
jgi:hypothetical protein